MAEEIQASMAAPEKREEQVVLRVDNLVKRFGDNTVLDHISFNVNKHETVAVLSVSP